MPFTPFHACPAAAIKAVIPRYFRFTVFCFAQVVTDCESAYHMIRQEYPVHRWMHTYAGATLVALFCIIVGRPFCQFFLGLWNKWRDATFKHSFLTTDPISWTSASIGAFIGTYSHVFLDSVTHSDVAPFGPINSANPFYSNFRALAVHLVCIILGLLGSWFIAKPISKRE